MRLPRLLVPVIVSSFEAAAKNLPCQVLTKGMPARHERRAASSGNQPSRGSTVKAISPTSSCLSKNVKSRLEAWRAELEFRGVFLDLIENFEGHGQGSAAVFYRDDRTGSLLYGLQKRTNFCMQ